MINGHKSGEWKIQLTMHVNFISDKDAGETRTIYVWSDNKEILVGNETNNFIKKNFWIFWKMSKIWEEKVISVLKVLNY